MKASEAPDALSQQNSNRLSFDLELNMLRDLIQDEVVTIMTDQESIVKQTILASNISKLCVFLGPQRGRWCGSAWISVLLAVTAPVRQSTRRIGSHPSPPPPRARAQLTRAPRARQIAPTLPWTCSERRPPEPHADLLQ